ncbi:hypothetical protein D9M68_621640 [compost metagenome]
MSLGLRVSSWRIRLTRYSCVPITYLEKSTTMSARSATPMLTLVWFSSGATKRLPSLAMWANFCITLVGETSAKL